MHPTSCVVKNVFAYMFCRRRIRIAGLRCCLALVVVLPTLIAANAQAILIDDFNDGNDEGWTHLDGNRDEPWGPSSFDASSGSYHLTTPGDVPVGLVGPAVSLWDKSSDPMFSNGFVRAKVRTGKEGSLASVFLRVSGDFATGIDGYLFHAAAGDWSNNKTSSFYINRIEGTQNTLGWGIPGNLEFGVGEDWWIEAGAVDNLISMKVWRDGEPKPIKPQLVVEDSVVKTGMIGVESNIFANPAFPEPTPLDASFDDLYFVPFVEGDFDRDGELTSDDIDLLTAGSGFDLNEDGAVDVKDRRVWIEDLFGSFLGDADLNAGVEFADFLSLSANFGEAGGWEAGDFDGSGDVQFADFLLLSDNFGQTAGAVATVPEPTNLTPTVLLTSLLVLAAVRIDRKRNRSPAYFRRSRREGALLGN